MSTWLDRKVLLFSTASAVTLVYMPSAAIAQVVPQAAESAVGALGDIIVTARRRDEKLQDVPQAITVLTAADLVTQQVRDQNDLQSKVPALSIAGRFGKSGGTYAMRGLTGTNSGTPTVGTYFAEVPTPTNSIGFDTSAGQALYDLESVQVLKGPQGTLFGRSTTAGAVLLTPAAPDLNEIKGNASISAGSMGYLLANGAISIPIIEDVLAIRVAANHNHRRGYTRNLSTGAWLDGLNDNAQRISVRFQPASWFRNTTIYDRFNGNQSSSAYVPIAFNPNLGLFNQPATTPAFNAACNGAVAAGLSASVPACVAQRLGLLASIRASLVRETARTSAGGDALREVNAGNTALYEDRSTHHRLVNRTEIDLPALGALELQLKNIFGYQHTKGFIGINVAGIPDELVVIYVGVGAGIAATQTGNRPNITTGLGNKFYSNETQLTGKLGDDRLVFTVGYYYQHAPSTPDLTTLGGIQKAFGGVTTVNLGYSPTNPFTVGGRAKQSAFYGQATLSLDGVLDGVKLTAGVRHTKDDFLLQTAAATVPNPVTGTFVPSATIATQALKTSGTNYNFSIDYKVNPDFLVYIATRKGYVPGGLNNANAAGSPNFKLQFDPESIKDVEAGIKWDFNLGETRGRFNLAAYQAWYSNIQRPFTAVVGGAALSYVANVAKGKLRGIELDLLVMPTRNLTLGVNYAHSDTRYTQWNGADPYGAAPAGTNLDLSNNPFQNAPRHKINLNATFEIPLSGNNGAVAITGQYSHQSRVWYVSAAERYIQIYTPTTPTIREAISQKGYGIANMRIDWKGALGQEGLTASIFARNLFDQIYAISGSGLNNSLGVTSKQFGEPRVVGGSLSFQF
jgi:iron complex outermembrane recepter protein